MAPGVRQCGDHKKEGKLYQRTANAHQNNSNEEILSDPSTESTEPFFKAMCAQAGKDPAVILYMVRTIALHAQVH
jgi:hypothetical protein